MSLTDSNEPFGDEVDESDLVEPMTTKQISDAMDKIAVLFGTKKGDDGAKTAFDTDPIVEEVRDLLLERSRLGIAKYGTTLGRNDLSTREWLVHARDEALDLALYLTKLIRNEKP